MRDEVFNPRKELDTSSFLQEEYPLIGDSLDIIRIRNQIEFSDKVSYPIFISGEIGTEKISIAKQMHKRRGFEKDAFIHVSSNITDIVSYNKFLKKSLSTSSGGTLYLSEVDLLPEKLKIYLMDLFTGTEFNNQLLENKFHLIISCTNSLISHHDNPQYIAKIFGCTVPHLEINIPALRERKEDLKLHVNYILKKLSINHIEDVAIDILLSYDWPGNLDQLQRVLFLLASCSDGNITKEDVLALNLIKKTNDESDTIGKILSLDIDQFNHVHQGLKKAILYMGENFKEDISLANLSDVACTSSSHLSFLFRNYLDLSFKTILVQVRVRYAKQLIEASPQMKITDISLQSGFGDLSHFEKMFKRYVGYTPRQHRQKLRLENKVFS
ncbi:helix-turn-helix domain-containing protein [Marinomonas sp.]|uniref:helix-turn-helix domain-containing protein n=1 Tax=Marinomonas sp. TaxID=1904862 RepID=UPI003BA91A82